MKKVYLAPNIEIVKVGHFHILSGSGIESDLGIGLGGEDDGGLLDPEAREFNFDNDDFDI